MEKSKIDLIIDDLIVIKPILIKGLIKPPTINPLISSGAHYILLNLAKLGSLSMSEVGKNLQIPMPNVTPLVDKLIEKGFVERAKTEKDRRVTKIKLTKAGDKYVVNLKKKIREFMKEKLLVLTEEEIETLNDSLSKVKDILLKINISN